MKTENILIRRYWKIQRAGGLGASGATPAYSTGANCKERGRRTEWSNQTLRGCNQPDPPTGESQNPVGLLPPYYDIHFARQPRLENEIEESYKMSSYYSKCRRSWLHGQTRGSHELLEGGFVHALRGISPTIHSITTFERREGKTEARYPKKKVGRN